MKTIVYTFSVTATLPLTDDPQHPDFYTESQATSAVHRHNMEKSLHRLLRQFEGDCDSEMMSWKVEDDGAPHDHNCECESCQHERAADAAEEGL